MSKRGELKNLSKIIEDVFSQKHFRIGIDNIRVQDAWVKTMGENIQKYTYKVYYKRGILYVKLKSSVLKEELTFEKAKIIGVRAEQLAVGAKANIHVPEYLTDVRKIAEDEFYQKKILNGPCPLN